MDLLKADETFERDPNDSMKNQMNLSKSNLMQTPNSKDTKSTNISINQLSGIKRSQNKSPDMNVSISSNLNAMSIKK